MIVASLARAHQRSGSVAIPARADTAADDHRRSRRFMPVPNVQHHLDGCAVDALERLSPVAELLAPVRIGAPGRAFQDEAGACFYRHQNIAVEIGAKHHASDQVVEEDERKISVVSNPPSVRNRPPPSCGSRSRYFACLATVFRYLSWSVGTGAVGGENAGFACDDPVDLRYRVSGAEAAEFSGRFWPLGWEAIQGVRVAEPESEKRPWRGRPRRPCRHALRHRRWWDH